MKPKNPSSQILLMSLAVKNTTNMGMELNMDDKISAREWSNANLNYIYPGPGEPVSNKVNKICQKRVCDEVIRDFIEWLYTSDFLESLSFGQKVVHFNNGFHFVIDSIKRTNSYAGIIKKYAQWWMTEQISDNPPKDQDTCEIMNDFGMRCCQVVGHEGNCNFQSGEGMCNSIDSDELCTDCSVI